MNQGNRPTFIHHLDEDPEDLPRTFIDDYADWAQTVTDAPAQYHRVTGVVILSTILTPYVYFETSFGTIRPNVWAMILAGTTVTRKSTSMDLAMAMLDDVMEDYMLGTDGSPEGLLTELANRDGKVSLFHRDEITGFMAQVSGRDYMSGLLETFTRLYDGKREKRILRKESIEIDKPRLVFMAGGIKTRMEEIVGMEHIRSGFLPRFLFVTGSTTSDQIRPIGPPVTKEEVTGMTPRDEVLQKLWGVANHYLRSQDEAQTVQIAGIVKIGKPKSNTFEIKGTPEAWERIRLLKDTAIKLGEKASSPELYTPIYDRLSNTVIKVALLIAGAELTDTLTHLHVQKAISLSQEWLEAVTDFAGAIESAPEMTQYEKKIDKILTFLHATHPDPAVESYICEKFRIRKKDIIEIRETLVDRGAIYTEPPHPAPSVARAKIIWRPTDKVIKHKRKEQELHAQGRRLDSVAREDSFRAPQSGHKTLRLNFNSDSDGDDAGSRRGRFYSTKEVGDGVGWNDQDKGTQKILDERGKEGKQQSRRSTTD